jgi:hypothetical protein
MRTIEIKATWNVEDRAWVVRSDDLPGLRSPTEFATLDSLWQKLHATMPELIGPNGISAEASDGPLRLMIYCSPWLALCSYLMGFA